jgi:hypothetical protein
VILDLESKLVSRLANHEQRETQRTRYGANMRELESFDEEVGTSTLWRLAICRSLLATRAGMVVLSQK